MNQYDCLQLLRQIKDVSFATVDHLGKPKNRIIDVMGIQDGRLIFCTARGKDFYRELLEHPYVGVAGLTKTYQMIRLHGPVKKLEESAYWIDKIFENNPSMKEVYPEDSRYILEPFCIEEGELEYFDLSVHPIVRYSFTLGASHKEITGFEITDACIECGACARNCPQQCIHSQTPFQIDDRHCLHCGLCMESCPVDAIRKRG